MTTSLDVRVFVVSCNVRAPSSAGWNFRQCFYAILYPVPSHPLTYVQNFMEIVPGEPLRRGHKRKWGSKIERFWRALQTVKVVCANQPVEIFGSVSTPFCTLAIRWPRPCQLLWRSSQEYPSPEALMARGMAKWSHSGPNEGYILETVRVMLLGYN